MLTILPNREYKTLLTLFDGQLMIDVEFDPQEKGFEDNIMFSLREDCPPEEKILKTDEASFNMTSAQARTLAQALLFLAEKNEQWLARHK